MMPSAAGPSSTMNRVGRMKRIIGTVSRAGRRAAFSSARVIRAVAHFGGEDAQRLGQRSAEFGGLLQRIDDAADAVGVGPRVEVVERHAAVGQKGQFGGGDAEFFAELGPALPSSRETRTRVASRLSPASAQMTIRSSASGRPSLMLLAPAWPRHFSDRSSERKSRSEPPPAARTNPNCGGIGSRCSTLVSASSTMPNRNGRLIRANR